MTPTFLSVGECMVEMAPFDNDLFKMNFAGDTLNTAWYARQLLPVDWRVSYCTCIGEDQLSAQMHAFMEASSIDTSHISTVPNRTVGLYVTQLDGGERSFTYWRENSAARRLAARSDHIEAAFVAAGIIFFSGITLAILPEADRAVFLDQLEKARRNGVQVAFDPNLRPQLWENEDVMCRQIMAAARIC
ncbi:sugar kinase, partial [Roseibium hamelinense]